MYSQQYEERVALTGDYEHSPVVTADNTLTLLKKGTGIGERDTHTDYCSQLPVIVGPVSDDDRQFVPIIRISLC